MVYGRKRPWPNLGYSWEFVGIEEHKSSVSVVDRDLNLKPSG
jgi:hypothetical protein